VPLHAITRALQSGARGTRHPPVIGRHHKSARFADSAQKIASLLSTLHADYEKIRNGQQ
jgi:hypothetical protein